MAKCWLYKEGDYVAKTFDPSITFPAKGMLIWNMLNDRVCKEGHFWVEQGGVTTTFWLKKGKRSGDYSPVSVTWWPPEHCDQCALPGWSRNSSTPEGLTGRTNDSK